MRRVCAGLPYPNSPTPLPRGVRRWFLDPGGDSLVRRLHRRVQRLLENEQDDGKVVQQMFSATIGRDPNPAEKDIALTALAKDRTEGAQNLQWALLNLAEFLYNF